MRSLLHVAGMFIFGGVMLVVAGLAFHARVIAPPRVELTPRNVLPGAVGTTGTSAEVATGTRALHTLLAGVVSTLDAAADALEHRRGGAAPMLDRAWRLVRVIRDAAPDGGPGPPLRDRVQRARRALQNGAAVRAEQLARQAAALAESAPAVPVRFAVPGRDYEGAAALDPFATQVGTVAGTTARGLAVEFGGVQDVLGFLDLQRGRTRVVPFERVVAGTPRLLQQTDVVLLDAASGG